MPRFLVCIGPLEYTSHAASSALATIEAMEHFAGAIGKVTVTRLQLQPAP